MLTGDSAAAVAFLQAFEPSGPWCLTAIPPDKKGLETATFRDAEEMLRWIDARNGKLNLYFHVNPVLGKLTKKAEREDIAAVTGFHIDLDPKKGEDIEGEQQRILGLLTTGLSKLHVPIPTFIIFSGGGYQAFWKLETPIAIDGILERAEDAKLYNKQLEIVFGADNCHNIDRLMRIPGTVNLPDARKLKAGRVPVLARIVQDNREAGAVYPVERFTKAVINQADVKPHDNAVAISGNVRRTTDMTELDEYSVPNRTKIVIAQGKDPDNPLTGDNSRSAWLWYVLCELARCSVPPDVIYGIITDPVWAISDCILDKGRSADADARRQIARAFQFAENPALLRMNEKHFCVVVGGDFRIATWEARPDGTEPAWAFWSKTTFTNHYNGEKVEVGRDKDGKPIFVDLAQWWLDHPKRRRYEGVIFAPKLGPEATGYYNLWQGFARDAKPDADCSLFLAHCRDVLCGGNELLYKYLLGWMARLVQEPSKPGEVAVVLRGERGAGKSFFAHVLGSLFGRHYLAVSNSQHLVGNFNAHLQKIVLLFADEAFFAGDKKHESVLKTLITEPRLIIERKGVDPEPSPNCIHLIMASNDAHVVPVGRKERRFFVLDVSDSRMQDHNWFADIAAQLDAGGREALLYFLLHYDLSGFNVRAVPQTEALTKQLRMGHNHVESWWKTMLEEGTLAGRTDWPEAITKTELFNHYYATAQQQRIGRPHNSQALGTWLSENVRGLRTMRRDATIQEDSGQGFLVEKKLPRAYHYILPSLAECRQQWEAKWGPEKWPAEETKK